eukprot:CAMPEP_0184541868 /NCGR_PEP_ID=MMETSP0199_2-20130426/1650_1 /TAXON_ID=1112570 /ORGANISM="Thraustochytrium sp., Strain LLF1b" /LENGTH=427 /DNA_ID=CAMNT_0026935619 /DNA_START=102 /DNA_END=1385 /DNA_ORIENTATION=-
MAEQQKDEPKVVEENAPAAKEDESGKTPDAKDMIMQVACASALTGVTLKHGGPFGACVVRNGIFISVAHNTVLMDNDPTCHAEMNAIRYACHALDTHDLSDCELYTSCEPCPMCLGACSWSRIRKVYTGVDRFTAAEFGFDDKVFYDELEAHAGHWAVEPEQGSLPLLRRQKSRTIRLGQTQPDMQPSMLNMYWGIEKDRVKSLVANPEINRTYRRRMGDQLIGFHGGEEVRFGADELEKPGTRETGENDSDTDTCAPPPTPTPDQTSKYFNILENAIRDACECGQNKEREVFASCVVGPKGDVLSVSVNEVLKRRDCTATSEVLAIRKAAKILGTYNLAGCSMYSTIEPCVMSLGSILWARIDNLYYSLSQNAAARYGFEEGLLHYRELFADPEIVSKVMDTETRVGFETCQNVFKEWNSANGIIY